MKMNKFIFPFAFVFLCTSVFAGQGMDLYLEARTYFKSAKYNPSNYDLALKKVNQSLEYFDSNASAFKLRGRIWLMKKEYENALSDFEHALSLEPEDSWTFSSIAVVKFYQQKYDEALAFNYKAILLSDENDAAYANRAHYYYLIKDYEKALTDYNKALYLNANVIRALNGRGTVFFLMGEYEEALTDFNRVEWLSPEEPVPSFFKGLISEKRGNLAQAIEYYTDSITRSKKIPDPFNDPYIARSRVLSKLGKDKRAKMDLEKAEELNIHFYPDLSELD